MDFQPSQVEEPHGNSVLDCEESLFSTGRANQEQSAGFPNRVLIKYGGLDYSKSDYDNHYRLHYRQDKSRFNYCNCSSRFFPG